MDPMMWLDFSSSTQLRFLVLTIAIFARLVTAPWLSFTGLPHVNSGSDSGQTDGGECMTPDSDSGQTERGECADHNPIVYNRAELLAVSPSRPTAELTARLRALEIGVGLPRKRKPRRRQKHIKILYLNVQSCKEVTADLHDIILENNADVVLFTETWLKVEGQEAYTTAMTPAGYECFSFPRSTLAPWTTVKDKAKPGGGIAFIIKSTLTPCISLKPVTDYKSFECVEMKLTTTKVSSTCVCIYRPPPSQRNKLTPAIFLREFPELLSRYSGSRSDVSIFGDFNLHYDNPSDCYVRQMTTILTDHRLCQLVDCPTQRAGHTLDWIVVREEGSLVSLQATKEYPGTTDHSALICNLAIARPAPPSRLVTSRNLRRVDPEAFKTTVRSVADGAKVSSNDVDSLVAAYNDGLRQALDRHAPLVTRRVRDRPSAPWLSEPLRQARRERRQAERQWRKTGLVVHRQIYVHSRNSVRSCVTASKKHYYDGKINSAASSSKQLFQVTNELLGKPKSKPLPCDIPRTELAERFSDFFVEKIRLLRSELDSRSCSPAQFHAYNGPMFSDFVPVTEKEISDLITQSPSKSCMLDPIPTDMLKQYTSDLAPLITDIVNRSLSSGVVPKLFKQAVVAPLLKKSGLDVNILKHYRPVSNLPFVSKILEKVVLVQLQRHLNENGLFEVHQSAYRSGHSTETAVLSVVGELLSNADERLVSLVALLDLSAAFDTLDHSILLRRLECTFGCRGTVLSWFVSYLSERFQSVCVHGNIRSSPSLLAFGVPQGSVLGPVLFTLYSQPLSDIIKQNLCAFHKYADDTEISQSATPREFARAEDSIQSCVADILSWMNSNKLMLNPEKTEVMKAGTEYWLKQVMNSNSVSMAGSTLMYKPSVKYLGVTLDETLSMEDHISNVCRSSFLSMKRISSIRPCLSDSATATLVNATITSRLDYCNSVLSGVSSDQLQRLQRVQNNAARLILRKRRRDHATPLLKQLHWLPVESRITFKVATLAYRHFDGSLPQYLSNSLTTYQSSRTLRSSTERLLRVPKTNLQSAGRRSFAYSAPSVWNSLPPSLRNLPTLSQFKANLKTHLFRQSFHLG